MVPAPAQGRPELALAIYLRLQQPDVFEYIAVHGLAGALEAEHVAPLMRIHEGLATALLAERRAQVPPYLVVPALQVGPPPRTPGTQTLGFKPWTNAMELKPWTKSHKKFEVRNPAIKPLGGSSKARESSGRGP